MAGDFYPGFSSDFDARRVALTLLAYPPVPERVTAEYVYQFFAVARYNIDIFLAYFGNLPIPRSTIPLTLLNQHHDRPENIAICSACLASDINAIIAYIDANNL